MTLHLTLTYLWVALGVIWLIGCYFGSGYMGLMWLDEKPPWWTFVLVVFWPVVLPGWIIYALLCCAFFRPWL